MNALLASSKPLVWGLRFMEPVLTHLRQRGPKPPVGDTALHFTTSSEYWESRYALGDTSGPGSYGRLARFKAEFLNEFCRKHNIQSVVEFGCGDGSQLALAKYASYIGVDVSQTAVDICRRKFSGDVSKRFVHLPEAAPDLQADLALSLDVIFHLVEDSVFEAYMRRLYAAARRFVIVYSSNREQPWPNPHVRHREFTRWVAQNVPDWRLQSTVKNRFPYKASDPERTSFSDFHVFAPS